MIFAALTEAADKGELLIADESLCRFHKRRDGVVVIREIIVLPSARRCGRGRYLINEIVGRFPEHAFLAKCPVGYESNEFWRSLGWTLAKTEKNLNWWQFQS